MPPLFVQVLQYYDVFLRTDSEASFSRNWKFASCPYFALTVAPALGMKAV